MNAQVGEHNDLVSMFTALLLECAAFETGITVARKLELRNQLMVLSHGKLTDSEFEDVLSGPNIIKPGGFLPVLEVFAELMPQESKKLFRKVFEDILSANGPLSPQATELLENIKSILGSPQDLSKTARQAAGLERVMN